MANLATDTRLVFERYAAQWDESKHPRDEGGKFTSGFHGTYSDFSAEDFEDARLGEQSEGVGTALLGHWFFKDQKDADTYQDENPNANVMPVSVEVNNPYTMTGDEFERFETPDNVGFSEAQELRDRLISQGFDGIVVPEMGWFAAFHGHQVHAAKPKQPPVEQIPPANFLDVENLDEEEAIASTGRIAEIDAKLAKLQDQYEKKSNNNQKSGLVPPPIKASALKSITDQMDKLDAEKQKLLEPPKEAPKPKRKRRTKKEIREAEVRAMWAAMSAQQEKARAADRAVDRKIGRILKWRTVKKQKPSLEGQVALFAAAYHRNVERYAAQWDEAKHPRAADGKFGSGGGAESGKTGKVDISSLSKEVLSRMSVRLKSMGYDIRGAADAKKILSRVNSEGESLLDYHEDWQAAYESAIGSTAKRKETAKTKKELTPNVNWARLKSLGLTKDWNETGYIGPRGQQLDFSGKREGGSAGSRAFDHREAGGTAGMRELIAAGYIRTLPESTGIDIAKEPTSQQYAQLLNFMKHAGRPAYIELQDGLGEWDESNEYYRNAARLFSREYPDDINPQRVINDIKRFFSGDEPLKLYARKTSRLERYAQWDEAKHPRAADGKFGEGGGAAKASQSARVAEVREKAAPKTPEPAPAVDLTGRDILPLELFGKQKPILAQAFRGVGTEVGAPSETPGQDARFGDGEYWSTSRGVAEVFAEYRTDGRVEEGDVRLERPFNFDAPAIATPEFRRLAKMLADQGIKVDEDTDFQNVMRRLWEIAGKPRSMFRGNTQFNELLRAAGYDGVIARLESPDFPTAIEIVRFRTETKPAVVEAAIAADKPVPAEVLADYPDQAKPAKPKRKRRTKKEIRDDEVRAMWAAMSAQQEAARKADRAVDRKIGRVLQWRSVKKQKPSLEGQIALFMAAYHRNVERYAAQPEHRQAAVDAVRAWRASPGPQTEQAVAVAMRNIPMFERGNIQIEASTPAPQPKQSSQKSDNVQTSNPWVAYIGKRGGRGWRNLKTGDKRYQVKRPEANDDGNSQGNGGKGAGGGVRPPGLPGGQAGKTHAPTPTPDDGGDGGGLAPLFDREGESSLRPDVEPDRPGGGSSPGADGGDPGDVPGGRKRRSRTPKPPVDLAAGNWQYEGDDFVGGSLKKKFQRNLAALKVVRGIEAEGRDRATPEEQKILSLFTGWGQFGQTLFNHHQYEWQTERDQLRAVMGDENFVEAQELNKDERTFLQAKRATPNSHFTSPTVVRAFWKAAQRLGFKGGRYLDPSTGSGYYLGMMPHELGKDTHTTAVERDESSAKVAKYLYPGATVKHTPFEQYEVPDNFYDLIASNVPFGPTRLSEQRYSKLRPYIHDHFILKSIDKARPGGMVMHVTSTGSMDNKKGERIRRQVAKDADLIAAIRLPDKTHFDAAGTVVVSDMLIFRKRTAAGAAGEETPDEAQPEEPGFTGVTVDSLGRVYHWVNGKRVPADRWLGVASVPDPDGGEDIPINQYFVDNPDQILGRLDRSGTMWRADSKNVAATDDFEELLSAAVDRLPEGLYQQDVPAEERTLPEVIIAPDELREGNFLIEDGRLYQRRMGGLVEIKKATPRGDKIGPLERIGAMIPIRAARHEVINAELTGRDPTAARQRLNDLYDAFREKYGTLTHSHNRKAMEGDPDAPVLAALETIDKQGNVGKADMFTKSTTGHKPPVESVDNVVEGVAVALNQTGRLDVDRIAELTGLDPDEVKEELRENGMGFDDPALGWVPREEYLSGNVRKKLLEARAAAENDPIYQSNVDALEKNQPADLDYTDISANLGAPWVPSEDMAAFAAYLSAGTASDYYIHYEPHTSQWIVDKARGGDARADKSASAANWTVGGKSFMAMLDAALNPGKSLTVRVKDDDGKMQIDRAATDEVRGRVNDIREEFEEWLWDDDERRHRLTELYNQTQNNVVDANPDGSHLTFPGMNPKYNPYDIQRNFAWHMIKRGRGYAGHEVGLGKTISMVASAMELRRLGLARKPCIVVQSSTIDQFTAAALDLYPGARILSTSGQLFDAKHRKETVARIASGDWDMVIMTHDNMDALPMKAEVQERYIREEIDELVSAMAAAQDEDKSKNKRTVKALEKRKAALEAEIKDALAGAKDDAVTFEELGVDMLFVDEAHRYKSLPIYTTMSDMKGVPESRSQRAIGMLMRARWLQEQNGGRGLMMASGTPVANTMAELYNVQRYMQSEEMKARGVYQFDSWSQQFGKVESAVEPTVTGEYRETQRFSKFVNVPDLVKMSRQDLDIERSEDMLDHEGNPVIKRPNRRDHSVETPQTDGSKQMMAEIHARAKAVQGQRMTKGADNVVSLMTRGRMGSVDIRLWDASMPDDPNSKTNTAVNKILQRYSDPDYAGSTQLLFSDIGVHPSMSTHYNPLTQERTRTPTGFHLYQDIIDKLVAGGIPRDQIADFGRLTGAKRQEAIAKLKTGEMRVGLGSTEKMGTGLNVQDNLSAMHHLDIPYKPGEIEQRNGRGWRQGNKYADVDINYYSTAGTFDEMSWGIVARKAHFIQQAITNPNESEREIEEISLERMSPAQLMAAASGDQRALRHMNLKRDLAQLRKAKDRHDKSHRRTRDNIGVVGENIKQLEAKVAAAKIDADHLSQKENFHLTVEIGGLPASIAQELRSTGFTPMSFVKRPLAADTLESIGKAIDKQQSGQYTYYREKEPIPLGNYRGLKLSRRVNQGYTLEGPSGVKYETGDSLASVEAVARNIKKSIDTHLNDIRTAQADIKAMEANVGRVFRKAADLEKTQAAIKQLEAEMKGRNPERHAMRRWAQFQLYAAQFDESKHPRAADGRFGTKSGESAHGKKQGKKEHEKTAEPKFRVNNIRVFPFFRKYGGDGVGIEWHGSSATITAPKYLSNSDLNDRILRHVHEYLSPLPDGTYIRVSSNPKDYGFIESGTHRGSVNHATGESEGGLSVAVKPEIPTDYAYLVTGDEIGKGSDGEPLLDTDSVKVASAMMSYQKLAAWYKKAQYKHINTLGISVETAKLMQVNPAIGDESRYEQFSRRRWQQFQLYAAQWDESKHPRAADGRFGDKAGDKLGNKLGNKRGTKPARQTDTPAFKKWFGNSKVIDENGEPLRVYHGTNSAKAMDDGRGFNVFDRSTIGRRDAGYFGKGFYFSPNPISGEMYAGSEPGARILPVYLNIQNPYIYERDDRIGPPTVESLREQGYDGIFVMKEWDGKRRMAEVIAFEPSQIKSATGNSGTWDPKDNRIDYAKQFDESEHFSELARFERYAIATATWDEAKHPRAADGRFGDKAGTSTTDPNETPQRDIQEAHRVEQAEAEWHHKGVSSRYFKRWFGDWEDDPANASKVVDQKTGEPKKTHSVDQSRVQDPDTGRPMVVYHGTSAGEFDAFEETDSTALYGAGFYFTEDRRVAETYETKGKSGALAIDPGQAEKLLKQRIQESDADDATKRELMGSAEVPRQYTSAYWAQHYINASDIYAKGPDSRTLEGYLNIRNPWEVDRVYQPDEIQEIFGHDGSSFLMDHKYRRGTVARREPGDTELTGEDIYEKILQNFEIGMGFGHGDAKDMIRVMLEQKGFDGISHVGGDRMGSINHKVWIAFVPTQIKTTNNRGTFDPADGRMKYTTSTTIPRRRKRYDDD